MGGGGGGDAGCLEHQGASVELVCLPIWKGEPRCSVQRQRQGEGRWECFCSLLPSSKSKALSP